MPHGCYIYAKAFDTTKAAMCAYHYSDNELPNWKCVLRFCSNCPLPIFLTKKHIIIIQTQDPQ